MPFRKLKQSELKPPLGSFIDWNSPVTKGLIGYWLLNEGAGNKVQDIVKYHTGSMVSFNNTSTSGWGQGKWGPCLAFDAVDDHVNATVTSAASGTVVAWIKPKAYSIATLSICGLSNSAGGTAQLRMDARWTGNSGAGDWGGRISDTNLYSGEVYNSTNFPSGVWTMLTMTYDTTSIKFYHKAKLVKSTAVSNIGQARTGTFSIGQLGQFGNSSTYDGSIDNLRIYNRAIQAAEVTELFTHPFSGIVFPKRRTINGFVLNVNSLISPYMSRVLNTRGISTIKF